jgi:hypothetical protein
VGSERLATIPTGDGSTGRSRDVQKDKHVDSQRAKEILRDLGARADLHGVYSLSEEEKTVLVPYWAARGVIGNGGFRYFFEGKHQLLEVARRMRLLQLNAVADACEKVVRDIFPNGVPPDSDAV